MQTISRLLVAATISVISITSVSAFAASEKAFRHLMFRETPFATYRGIYPLNAEERKGAAHYAVKYDENGRITEISYQINGKMIHGNEVWDSFIWFAPKVKIAYLPGKEVHTYFDADNNQINAHGNVYRAEYELDSKGRRAALRFFDKDGNATQSEWNVHRYARRFEDAKVYEKRFDLEGNQQPLRPAFKFYEVELEYDRDGKLAFMRNLGLDGTPTNNDSGAGIDRITYDHNGNFVRWQVYDKDGNPVEGNRPMVHLGEHLYDAYGNKVGMRGFDRFGNRMPFSWGSYEHIQTYDDYGNQRSHVMVNPDGSVDRHLAIEYTADNTRIEWLKSLDENEQLAASPMLGGAAALKYTYKDDGQRDRSLYNADMTPFQPPKQGSSE